MEILEINAVTLPVLIGALVEVIKRVVDDKLSHRYLPLLSIIIGGVIGFFTIGLLGGVVSGLIASGLYSVVAKSGVDTVKTMLK